MKMFVKKGDTVKVIAGNYLGSEGRVLKIFPKKKRVLVERVNMIIKHTKPSAKNQQGGRIEKEAPLHITNLMVICPSCSEPSRLGRKRVYEEKLNRKIGYRYCKKCGEIIRSKD